MKFKVTITEDVIRASLNCGDGTSRVNTSCAFAVAFNQLVPAIVCHEQTYFPNVEQNKLFHEQQGLVDNPEWRVGNTLEQQEFIQEFDSLRNNVIERFKFVGREFDVEIPDEVIEYWYGDASKATEKIANSGILQMV